MNRVVYRLLRGYLRRSLLLYALLGPLQFLMTGFSWAFRYDRVPVAGVILGIWGAHAAVNHQSLVWRWPLQAGGVVLCIVGYFVLVQQLRAGIRPSSNENTFSPG